MWPHPVYGMGALCMPRHGECRNLCVANSKIMCQRKLDANNYILATFLVIMKFAL